MTRSRLSNAALEVSVSLAVVGAAIVFALLLIAAAGGSPSETVSSFSQGAFGGQHQIAATGAKMVPLVLVALGWIVAFTAGRFHVGFPGQIILGGICASAVAVHLPGLPTALHLPLVILAGVLGGAAYAAVAAWLWAKRGVNEILSTLLLNLVAAQVLAWVVRGPLQESANTLSQTDPFVDSGRWPLVWQQTDLHWDIVLVPLSIGVIAFLLARTTFGFWVRLTGANPEAARRAGSSTVRIGVLAIVVSGLMAGLAGASLTVGGSSPAMGDGFASDYGYQGIAVALLARNSPWGVLPAALLFAALRQGGGVVQAQVGVSAAVVGITQGIVIIFVLAAAAYLAARRNPSRSRKSSVVEPSAGVST